MGVPVFSIYDKTHYFHPQNVTCSILQNSDLAEYIVESPAQLYTKIGDIVNRGGDALGVDFKQTIRQKFLSGSVCNGPVYLRNFQNLLTDLYNKHKSRVI